jgi:hypothetical protein
LLQEQCISRAGVFNPHNGRQRIKNAEGDMKKQKITFAEILERCGAKGAWDKVHSG